MSHRDRDLFALFIAAMAAALGAAALGLRADPGVQVRPDASGHLVVQSLGRFPPERNYGGVRPGMVVAGVDGRELIRFPTWPAPQDVEQLDPGNDGTPVPSPSPTPEPTPARPIVQALSADDLVGLTSGSVSDLSAVLPSDVDRLYAPGEEPNRSSLQVSDLQYPLDSSLEALWIGVLLMVAGGWWLVRGWAGSSLQVLAIPLAVAIGAPLVLLPTQLTFSPWLILAGLLLVVIASVPLAIGLYELVDDPAARRTVRLASTAAFVGAIAVGLIAVLPANPPAILGSAHWALASAVTFVPGFVAARPVVPAALADRSSTSSALVERSEILVAAVTVAVALVTFAATGSSPLVIPLLIWIAIVIAAGRYTFRPLARLATRATLQRDLVVAAMEAERTRIASDIHDDALQDVTLLVRRLEAAGDADGVELARGVADRLRTISGDLRLPILDDLGVGPALDWLVTRVERLAGGDVRLDVADANRPPAAVELAVFRIAQEALANAVKHGRPPIIVRYRSTPSGVSLSIDDAGPGIDPSEPEGAPVSGHYGLLGMSQRAEAIGAILDVRRWPSGGTHVALEWRPR